jgi:hypothetical protein
MARHSSALGVAPVAAAQKLQLTNPMQTIALLRRRNPIQLSCGRIWNIIFPPDFATIALRSR